MIIYWSKSDKAAERQGFIKSYYQIIRLSYYYKNKEDTMNPISKLGLLIKKDTLPLTLPVNKDILIKKGVIRY